MAMGTRKIGPAIAAGCTMVVKPAQQTPLSMLALARILAGGRAAARRAERDHGVLLERGLPSRSSRTRGCASSPFTGSTEVGRKLRRAVGASSCCATSMELGGNAPFVVFDDADVDAAVEGAMVAKMRNIGEACTAANRFHVARSRRTTSSPRSSRRDWAR